MATAFVALTSIEKSSKHSNLIDSELINSILNNPEVTEKLDKDYGVQNNAQYKTRNHFLEVANFPLRISNNSNFLQVELRA